MGNICNPEDETQEVSKEQNKSGNTDHDNDENDSIIDKIKQFDCCPEKKLDEKAVKQRAEFKAEIDRLLQPGTNYNFTQATFYRIPINLKGWNERFRQFGVTCHATGAENPLHVIIILTAQDDNHWLTEFNSSGVKLKYIGNKDKVIKMLQQREYIKMSKPDNSNVYGQTDNDEKDQFIEYQTCDKIEQPIKRENQTFSNCQKLAEWFQKQNQMTYGNIRYNCVDYAVELATEIEMSKSNIRKLKGPVMFVRDGVKMIETSAPFCAGFAMAAHAMNNNQNYSAK